MIRQFYRFDCNYALYMHSHSIIVTFSRKWPVPSTHNLQHHIWWRLNWISSKGNQSGWIRFNNFWHRYFECLLSIGVFNPIISFDCLLISTSRRKDYFKEWFIFIKTPCTWIDCKGIIEEYLDILVTNTLSWYSNICTFLKKILFFFFFCLFDIPSLQILQLYWNV